MRISPRLLATSALATMALALPGTAFAQEGPECVTEAPGSAAGEAEECEDFDPEVLGEVEVNPETEENPQPAPVPVTAPEVLTATGVDSDVLAIAAIGAIAVGGGAVFASRRKKTPTA